MKKILILILIISLPFLSKAQKVNDYKYKNVDTLIQYKNCQIIIYKDKTGKSKTDIIYKSKQKKDIDIDYVDFMVVNDETIYRKTK